MSLAVSPDTRHIKEHRVAPVVPGAQDHAVRILENTVPDGVLERNVG